MSEDYLPWDHDKILPAFGIGKTAVIVMAKAIRDGESSQILHKLLDKDEDGWSTLKMLLCAKEISPVGLKFNNTLPRDIRSKILSNLKKLDEKSAQEKVNRAVMAAFKEDYKYHLNDYSNECSGFIILGSLENE